METVPSKQPDNETSQHRAGNGTRTLWEPAVTQEEVARVWNDPGCASRLAVERIVMELATLTPDALLGRVGANQDDARAVAAVCGMLANHYRIAQAATKAVQERLAWALEMHQAPTDGAAVN